jgi:ubiquinone/menaquinone biosynthesis C-methylase UbiE
MIRSGHEPAEADRLREAYQRRGDRERAMIGNAGQRAIVAERDRLLRGFLRPIAPIASILDIGCGDGSVLTSLRSEGLIVTGVGIDLLPERIAAAPERDPALEFRVADALELPFADGSFDAVLSMTMFSSIPAIDRRLAILREIDRVVRPGGAFGWYDMRRRNPWNRDVSPFTIGQVRSGLPGWVLTTHTATVIPALARRLGPVTTLLYPVLSDLRILSTHLFGVAVKPVA